ncbi:MAG TPA: 23S rRNA (guanosine(2251)-2'-O)-methyltransferase RlmB [Chitinophagales bacterium]|nr:23S rRNA (guanosine(2251)-2'-O)-methyltransferase RlmB [Chitinophagales bacterium]
MAQEHFCIFGRKPVIEAIKAGKKFDKILLLKNASGDEIREIQQLLRDGVTSIQNVPREKLDNVARKYSRHREANHQGVIGFLSMVTYQTMEDVLHHVYAKGGTPLLMVLEGVTDVGNFGAIARSAECFGADALIIPAQGAAQVNPVAMKASAGALNNIYVCREKSLVTALKFLRVNGIKLYAADMAGAKAVSVADFSEPCAIVMGSEGSGISPELLKLCDEKITIPIVGVTGSLNVSVAAGIFLFEAAKARAANG